LIEEDEDGPVALEVGDCITTIFELGRTIKTAVLVVPVSEVFFHQVHHPGHLEVQQHAMIVCLQFLQECIQLSQLARISNEARH